MWQFPVLEKDNSYIWPNLPVINCSNSYDGCFSYEEIHKKVSERNGRGEKKKKKGRRKQQERHKLADISEKRAGAEQRGIFKAKCDFVA